MNCPNCSKPLRGELIYDTFFKKYNDEEQALKTAALYGGTKTKGWWGLEIALYDLQVDRTTAYRCPFCQHKWPVGPQKGE